MATPSQWKRLISRAVSLAHAVVASKGRRVEPKEQRQADVKPPPGESPHVNLSGKAFPHCSARAVLKCVQRAAASLPLSAAARVTRHAMPAAHAPSTASCSHAISLVLISPPNPHIRVAHMGEAVAGDMEWSAQAAAALHPNPTTAMCNGGRGGGAVLHSAGAGRESIGIGSYETSPSGGEFPSLPAAPLGGVRRFNGGSTAASRLKAPPPLTAAPDEHTLSIPSRLFIAFALSHMFPHMLAHIHLHIIFPCMLHTSSPQTEPLAAA
ncbi:unnamed protein product [Closterium sp. NIES-64]|nr:unnamed protein product [Closterium sp. NIES-64]